MLSASGAGLLCLMLHELTVISCSAQYTCSLHAGQHTLLGPVQWRQGLTASEGREAFSVPARLAQSRLCSPYEAARMGSSGQALHWQSRAGTPVLESPTRTGRGQQRRCHTPPALQLHDALAVGPLYLLTSRSLLRQALADVHLRRKRLAGSME